jgi:hypothetical protein
MCVASPVWVKSCLDGPQVGLPLYPLKADSERTSHHVGFVAITDIDSGLFDHLVGDHEQVMRICSSTSAIAPLATETTRRCNMSRRVISGLMHRSKNAS